MSGERYGAKSKGAWAKAQYGADDLGKRAAAGAAAGRERTLPSQEVNFFWHFFPP
jgi:hypothetical protein